jgi:hypothetical protein
MADGRWQVAEGGWQMQRGKQMADGFAELLFRLACTRRSSRIRINPRTIDDFGAAITAKQKRPGM